MLETCLLLSASDNLLAPFSPMLLSAMSENEMKQLVLQLRSSEVTDVLVLSPSAIWVAETLLRHQSR